MPENRGLGSRRALADAVSGVAASLFSLWTFYPIEVWKTNLQAGSRAGSRKKKSLYQGCHVKTLHTASSSFTYFYLYSFIFFKWVGSPKAKVNPATRLFLSAIAAMMNTLITLPLDVLSSREVTQEKEAANEDSAKKMDQIWDGAELQDEATNDEATDDSSAEIQDTSIRFEEEQKEDNLESDSSIQLIACDSFHGPEEDQGWSSLWKGLTPALLLCTNPSINYSVFDMTKNRILARRHGSRSTLTMPEAFLVGLFAKFVATIATYPLIRAKVILMVTSEKSLVASLCRSYREEGLCGLYRGCDWQLVHTLLKSALMMMVREKITLSTQRLIVGESTKKQ